MAKTNGAKSVTLPFERETKNFLVYSSLLSRDKEKAAEDTGITNKIYLRKDGFEKSEAVEVSIKPVAA